MPTFDYTEGDTRKGLSVVINVKKAEKKKEAIAEALKVIAELQQAGGVPGVIPLHEGERVQIFVRIDPEAVRVKDSWEKV